MITCMFEDGGKASLRHVVVHAIVENEGKLLLVKRAPKLLEGGKWSLPAGFLDRNETAQMCAKRELLEETGWEGRVGALFMIKTDPNRPHEDRQNVSISFIVEPSKKSGVRDDESTDVQWFPLDSLPSLDTLAFDHGETVGLYISYKKDQFPLPIVR